MKNIMTEHPKEVGLSYFGHFIFAWTVVFKLLFAVFACIIHAFLPFLFTYTTGKIVSHLHKKIHTRYQE